MLAIALRKTRSRSFSSSSRRRSVTSIPETRTSPSVRPVTSATGTAAHTKARRAPSGPASSDSISSDGMPSAAEAIARAARPSSSSTTSSRNGRPTSSESGQPSARRKARFAPTRGSSASRSRIVPSRASTIITLGIVSNTVVCTSRSRSSSRSRFRRIVMSTPAETIAVTAPVSSW